MPFPLRVTVPRRLIPSRTPALPPRREGLDGVFAVVAVAAVVALSVAANARRRVGRRVDGLRSTAAGGRSAGSAQEALAEPVTRT